MIKKKYVVYIMIVSLSIYVLYRYIDINNKNKDYIDGSTCAIDIVPIYPEEANSFYVKEYKILHDKGIKFLEEKNGNKVEIDKNDGNKIFVYLVSIYEANYMNRKELKNNKKEIIRKTYTLNNGKNGEWILIPKHLEEKLVSNKKNYIVTNKCEALRVLKGL